MDEQPVSSNEIKKRIDVEQIHLGQDIQQLEDKFTAAVDWRTHVRRDPVMLLGLAFAGGLLLSIIMYKHQ